MHIEGTNAKELFANEPGGHRWQRVSPTEKRGRIHTSTVTVAVLDENKINSTINRYDISYTMKRGSGPGGQHRNKTDSCVVATHNPTGLSVKIDARDQHKNKALATRILIERILEQEQTKETNNRCKTRKYQIGSGMRGDKRRTYRTQNDLVIDHITGKKWRLSKWIKGNW